MKFKEVNAFRAVMRTGSMTAAANELYTSQPNVSRLIAQLEASTRLQLFQRQAGRLVATQEGLAFLREVERAFVGLDVLQDAASNIRQFGNGRIRIAAVPSLAMSILPVALQRFHASHPEVRVSIETSNSETIAEGVQQQAFDLGLVSYLPTSAREGAQAVCSVAACCVLPPGHRLASRALVTAADLANESFISMAHGDGLRARVDAAFAQGDQRVMHFETPFGATICHMVGLGLGVSIVNPLVASTYLHTGIQMKPFKPDIAFVSYLLVPSQAPANALLQRFTTLLQQVIDNAVAALHHQA